MKKRRTTVSIYLMWATIALGPYIDAEGHYDATKRTTLSFCGPTAAKNNVPLGQTVNQKEPVQGSHGSVKFDEYGSVSSKEEYGRLSDFAIQLKAQPETQAYIIAYGGRRSWVGEANCRAIRAKNYLVRSRGINRHRIVTIDGGYREEPATGLYIRLQGGEPPVAFPTLNSSDVQIMNGSVNRKKRSSLRRACK